MSIAAFICMLPIFALRFIKKIPRRVFVWLWLIPFVRMCIPVGISGKYGIMALIDKFTAKTVTIYEIGDFSNLGMMNYVMAAKDYFPIEYRVSALKKLFEIASVIWIIVAILLIIIWAIAYVFVLEEVKDAEILRENIYISDKAKIPAVYGIIKPKIIIPAAYCDIELNYILMHERAHIRRKDNLIRILALILVCVHWFNPFSWLLFKYFCTDIELACDEAVLSKCSDEEYKKYAYALLNASEKTNILAASFGGAKIRRRIENVLSYKNLSLFSSFAFFAMIISIAYFLLTNA